MRIAIIQFPGSNCERETMLAVKRMDMEPVEFLWNESREKLRQMDGFIIVGGFSYEDRSRAGIIAALDPVMLEIKAQSELGKPILGICNGAQILIETGLVPGLENHKVGAALTENKRVKDHKILGTGFYNDWVYIRLSDEYQRNVFTRYLTPKNILHLPIAHAEGRFLMSKALLDEVKVQGLNIFQYCDANGALVDHFPINPNGSLDNMAAIANKTGNVMAIMPHPERTVNGDAIFQSMRQSIEDTNSINIQTPPLYYYPRPLPLKPYQKPNQAYECIVKLVITDNQALTVQNTLNQHGIPVSVKRYSHWEIHCDNENIYQQIKQSEVLFNKRKENEQLSGMIKQPLTTSFLVRAQEDLFGREKLQTLMDHFSIQGVQAIYYSVLWQFAGENVNMPDQTQKILKTNIIYNPYAHDCYQYI